MKNNDFRIGVVSTAYVPQPLSKPFPKDAASTSSNSHTGVILRRWVAPLATDAEFEWTGPRTSIASLYVMQKSEDDLSSKLCHEFGIRESSSVVDALTLGTGTLAVDAVMMIAEHGDFPENELQQKLYPRKELLDEILKVMEQSGRVVPLFFDKHFSWNPAWIREMYFRLEEMAVPWFGGSSLSHCPMVPPVPSLEGEKPTELVMTSWAGTEIYLFHALELVQSIVEKRKGGETGIRAVRAWSGEGAWAAMDRGEFSMDLLRVAVQKGSPDVVSAFEERMQKRQNPPEIFQYHYQDGLKATIVRLNETTRKWAWACQVEGWEEPIASAPVAQGAEPYFYAHFARFARRIEDFFLSGGVSPVAHERLFITSMACAYGMQALSKPGVFLPDGTIPCPPKR
jgi:hypothetical protein